MTNTLIPVSALVPSERRITPACGSESVSVVATSQNDILGQPLNATSTVGQALLLKESLSPNKLREGILLETKADQSVRKAKVEIAKNLAQKFKEEANRLITLFSQKNIPDVQPHIFMQRRLALADQNNLQAEVSDIQEVLKLRSGEIPLFEVDAAKTSAGNFTKFLNYVIKRNNLNESDIDAETVMFCAYYLLKAHDPDPKSKTKFVGFDKLPDNFFDYEKEIKLRVLAKHFFIDLKGYSTARDVEKIRELEDEVRSHHMAALFDHNSDCIHTLIKNTFPGFADGENPNIRLWLIRRKNMWQNGDGAVLAGRAVRFTLKYVAKVFDQDGSLNVDSVRKISRHGGWEAMLTNKENPLEGLVSTTPLRTIRQVVLLGLPEVKGSIISELALKIGQDHEKISDEDMDKITEELVRIHCFSTSGEITNEAICAETRWAIRYNEVDKRIFVKSNFKNAYEALVHKYPERFGWKEGQIPPGDITFGNMWKGSEGVRLFRERFAHILSTVGLGTLSVTSIPIEYSVSKDELDRWISERGQDPISYILKQKIRFPGFADVCKRNLTQAYKTLFGSSTDFGILEKSFKRQLLTNLFEECGGELRIRFGPVLYGKEIKEESPLQEVMEVKVVEEMKEPVCSRMLPYPVENRIPRPIPLPIKNEPLNPELGTRILRYIRVFDAHQTNSTIAIGLIKGAFKDLELDSKLLNSKKIVFNDDELKEKIRKYLVLSEKSFDLIVKFVSGCRIKNFDVIPVRTVNDTDAVEY